MFKKASFYSLALAILFTASLTHAIKPEISKIRDERDGRERLRVVGSFTATPKQEVRGEASGDEALFSPVAERTPLNVRIRTIEPKDFGTVEAPGPITLQRGGPLMDSYEGGRRLFNTTIDQGFPLWDGRLLEMSPATNYCLETEEGEFIGHMGLGRQTPTQFVFFAVVEEKFQRRGITRTAFEYLTREFIPELRRNPITAATTAPFLSILVKMDVTNPLEETALREVGAFAATHHLGMEHTVGAPSLAAFTEYARRHEGQKFKEVIDPSLKRTEHRWVIDISDLPSSDDATAAASASADEQPA